MGSSASGHTFVETEVPNFKAGAHVPGVIKILVEEPVNATHLHLKLIGKEKTQWQEQRTRNYYDGSKMKRETYYETLKGSKKFLQLSFPVWNFGGSIAKGQYTIPFGIQLPNWLPPSFHHSKGSTQAEISYKLKASAIDSDKIKAHKNLIWIKSLPNPESPISQVTGQETFQVRNCCCFSAGITEATAILNRNIATIDDNLIASVLVNNSKGRRTVIRIASSLVRTLRMRNDHNSHIFTDVMLESHEVVSIKPGDSILPEKFYSLAVGLKAVENLWKFPSTRGILIECIYTLDVVLTFDNFCGCGNYRVKLPVEIYNGEVIPSVWLLPAPQIPNAWNPIALASAPIESELDVQVPIQYFQERETAVHNY